MLKLDNVCSGYGQREVLHNLSIEVGAGEIVALIGANGAGKTTTLMTISGLVKTSNGRITFNGKEIQNQPPTSIVKHGIIQIPEGRHIFPQLTVLENLQLGAFLRTDAITRDLDYVFSLFPILFERKNQKGGTLSGGEQQMLAIARGLMAHPKLLLLDEPSLGLAPKFVDLIFEVIQKINHEGVTILLVEQNAHRALIIAKRGYVMELGKVVVEDLACNLLQNQLVRQAYLGT